MRVLILITLFCNMAFSALYLSGAEYTQVVTINHSHVAETSSDFLYQLKIPREGALLTAVESADDVAFTNVNDTTRRARWVVYTPDTIFLYAHIAVSSTVDTSYRLQYGKALNEVNSSATFTNCGISNYWGFNETGGTTAQDMANALPLTVVENSTLGSTGFFYNGLSCEYGGCAGTSTNLMSGVSAFSHSFLITANLYGNGDVLVSAREGSTIRYYISTTTTDMSFIIGSTASYGSIPLTQLFTGEPFLLTVVYDGSQTTNSTRLVVYVNGVQKTLSFTGTIPASIPLYTTTPTFDIGGYRGNAEYYLDGAIDEVCLTNLAVSSNCVNDRFNMLFIPSTFSTLGTPIATEFSAEMGIDTLTFTCSAENAMTYQWYLDGAEIVGETDSVLVIYADSTFYSTAHTLYCLVNSSVISDSWVIATEFSAEMGIDTLRLVCSAENALTYQWYDNNVAVSGATDSVYTIYADSTFYSIKHVIYCLVNGSVVSDSWIIRDTSGFLQRLFQRNRGFGRGR